MKDKKVLHINDVGRIIIDDKFTHTENQDHCVITTYSYSDGIDYYYDKLRLTVPGLQALYKEVGDILRAFEERRNPR